MAKPIPTFYVFHGEDDFTCSETLTGFKRRLGPQDTVSLNTTVLDGKGLTLAELRHACEAIPFLADKRLVIVHGLLTTLVPRKGQELSESRQGLLDRLADYLPRLPRTTRLVFVEDTTLPSNHPVLALAEQEPQGYVKHFEEPAPKSLPFWIRKRVRKCGGNIEPRASARLASVVGSDLRLLDQEIAKLLTYATSERAITETDIETLVPYSKDAVIFDLVDALGHRDGPTAAKTLHRLLEAGEHPLGLFGMIVRQFRLLIQVEELKGEGASRQDVARTLKLHPFPAGKLYAQVAHFTDGQLEKVYRHLSDTDLEIKTGRMKPEVALDLLVAGLAGSET